MRILITGSHGLIGSALAPLLARKGVVERLDLVALGDERGDVRNAKRVQASVARCDGVVHLAAVSRVITAERDPARCRETNVVGLRNVLNAAIASSRDPWVLFASSREVYGAPSVLPVDEDCPMQPVNVYGRCKVAGERMVAEAREAGLRACVARLSNVFGSPNDHADRVVPAFARAAIDSGALRVDGATHTFDFTHLDDVASGMSTLVDLLGAGDPPPPPIHFVSGVPTTLDELARLTIELAGTAAQVRYAPARDFDVDRFYGCPARARSLLGWSSQVPLRAGLTRLLRDLRRD